MPWLADRFTLPLRSESWTLAQMELPSQVSNTLWGHRVALQKYAKLLATKVSNDSIQICRVLFVVQLFSAFFKIYHSCPFFIYFQPLGEGHSSCTRKEWRPVDVPGSKKPAAIFAVVPFTACIFQMDFGFCFCSILLTSDVVHSLHQKLFDSHMSQ